MMHGASMRALPTVGDVAAQRTISGCPLLLGRGGLVTLCLCRMHGILFGMSLLGRCGLDATKIKMNAGIPHLARLVHPGARLLNPVPERPIGEPLVANRVTSRSPASARRLVDAALARAALKRSARRANAKEEGEGEF